MSVFTRLDNLFSPISNYRNYRDALSTAVSHNAYPIFPYLAVDLRDVTFANDGNPSYLDESSTLVNLEKIEILGRTIDQVLDFQRHAQYQFKLPKTFHASLLKTKLMTEEEMHKRSVAIHPVMSQLELENSPRHVPLKPLVHWSDQDISEWVRQYPNCKEYLNHQDKFGWTLLHKAAADPSKIGVSTFTRSQYTSE
jgi:hypothetical protein